MVDLSVAIQFKSPAAFRFLSTHFGLPCLSLLQSKCKENMASSGLCSQIFNSLKLKFSDATTVNRYCSVVFDGITIKPCLQYMSNDQIDGFEELSVGVRRNVIATDMVVLMARGVTLGWKQVSIYILIIYLF